MDTEINKKISARELDNLRGDLHKSIGKCDQIANEREDHEQAYNELREAIDLYLDKVKQTEHIAVENHE